MHITLRQLSIFVAIAQEKTITAAAEKLFISKPAASMALAELEKQLGRSLFDRHHQRLMINASGRRLLPLADEVLNRAQTIESLFADDSALAGELRIGASKTIGNQLMPFLLRDFRNRFEHRQQQLSIGNSREIAGQLLDFELDLGFIEGRVEHPKLTLTPWHADTMCIACPPDHPLADAEQVRLADLDEQDWILREEGSGSRDFFLHHIAPELKHWHTAFELDRSEAILRCVSAGLGLTCLSQLTAESACRAGLIRVLPLVDGPEMKRTFWCVTHKDKAGFELLDTFIRFSQQWPASFAPPAPDASGNTQ